MGAWRLCLVTALTAAWPGTALAEHPAGTYSLSIDGRHEIYRVAASLLDGNEFLPGPDCTGRSPGATGKLIFDCELPYPGAIPNDVLPGVVKVLPSNTIEGGVGTSHVRARVKFAGTIRVGPERAEVTITVGGRGDVDPGLGAADVPLKLKQCVEVAGERVCQSASFGAETVIMEALDASWSLDLDIVDLGGRTLGGTATATFQGPVVLSYDIVGSYDRSEDTSTLKLVPQSASKGNVIVVKNLQVTSGAITGGKVRYEVWGHEGRIRLPLAP